MKIVLWQPQPEYRIALYCSKCMLYECRAVASIAKQLELKNLDLEKTIKLALIIAIKMLYILELIIQIKESVDPSPRPYCLFDKEPLLLMPHL